MNLLYRHIQLGLLALLPYCSNAQTFHALIACDTVNPTTGKNHKADLSDIQSFSYNVAKASGLDLNIIIFTPNNSSAKNELEAGNILTTIQNLKVKKDDVIFFYYTGHGAPSEDEFDQFPVMALDGRNPKLQLSEVREAINLKHPRFSLVFGDTCNSFPQPPSRMCGLFLRSNSSYAHPSTSFVSKINKQTLAHLFTDYSGNITVCSAAKGYLAFSGPKGASFTQAFLTVLNTSIDDIGWESILDNTAVTAYRYVTLKPYYEIDISKDFWAETNITYL